MPFQVRTRFLISDYGLDLRSPVELPGDLSGDTVITIKTLPPSERREAGIGAWAEAATVVDDDSIEAELRAFAAAVGADPEAEATSPVLDFGDRIYEQHSAALARCLKYLRWRMGLPSGHRVFVTTRGVVWTGGDAAESLVPVRATVTISDYALQRPSEAVVSALTAQDLSSEPLGHELLREAQEQVSQNPRSSLIIGVSAVEVGTKQCIAALVPDAEWLVSELQTPPVHRLLQEYLPKLPGQAAQGYAVMPPPQSLINAIKEGVRARNGVAHAGKAPLPLDELSSLLSDVRDVLYLLDCYRGHSWALDHVRDSTRRTLRRDPALGGTKHGTQRQQT